MQTFIPTFTPFFVIASGHCNFRLRADEPVCMNGTCPVSMGQAEPQSSEEFDIPVMWTDHTGSVERSRINGRAAEAFLGVTVRLELNYWTKGIYRFRTG